MPAPYSHDPTGTASANKITNETHALAALGSSELPHFHIVVPRYAPFFADSAEISFISPESVTTALTHGIDYIFTHPFVGASRGTAKPVYGSILILNTELQGTIRLDEYQTLGGDWVVDDTKIAEILADRVYNPRITTWEVIADLPAVYPPVFHQWDLDDMVGMTEVVAAMVDLADTISSNALSTMGVHLAAVNPHGITPAIIGAAASDHVIKGWAQAKAWRLVSATYNGSQGLDTASIIWPDGATGTYTTDTFNGTDASLVDAWHATYSAGSVNKTATQTAVTRNGSGSITAQPAITIA